MKEKKRLSWITVAILGTLVVAIQGNGFAQTQINLATQGRNVDFTGAPFTRPIKSGTTLPTQCSPGDFFLNTSSAPGQNLFACLGSTWTMMAAQNGLSDPGTSGLVKRTGPNSTTAVPAPNGSLVGTTDVQTLSGKSIDASEVNSGVLTGSRMPAMSGDITTSAGSTVTALNNVLGNPGTFGDATHSLQVTVDSKGRVTSVNTLPISAGAGNQASTISAISSGAMSSLPGSCSTGNLYFVTDQSIGQQIYTCSGTNSWSQLLSVGGSGALAFTSGSLDIVPSIVPRLTAANTFTGANTFQNTQTFSNINVTGTCTGCNSSGFANPMTAQGDLITGGVSGAAARLPIGGAGQVLTVSASGQAVWSTPAAVVTPTNGPVSGTSLLIQSVGSSQNVNLEFESSDGVSHYDFSAASGSAQGLLGTAGGFTLYDVTHGQTPISSLASALDNELVLGANVVTVHSVQLKPSTARPSCSSSNEGQFWYTNGSGSTSGVFSICQNTNGTYGWVNH